jgi:hypothetical protein
LEKHFKLHSCAFLRGCIVYISTGFPLLVIYDQLESKEWGESKSVEQKEKLYGFFKKTSQMTLRGRDRGVNEAEKENKHDTKTMRHNGK